MLHFLPTCLLFANVCFVYHYHHYIIMPLFFFVGHFLYVCLSFIGFKVNLLVFVLSFLCCCGIDCGCVSQVGIVCLPCICAYCTIVCFSHLHFSFPSLFVSMCLLLCSFSSSLILIVLVTYAHASCLYCMVVCILYSCIGLT